MTDVLSTPETKHITSNFSNSFEKMSEIQHSLIKQKYKEYSREQLLKEIKQLRNEDDLKLIKQEYYLIRDEFVLKTKVEDEQRLAHFILEGGRKEDYVGISDPITDEFYEMTNQLKESIRLYNAKVESEKNTNLEERKNLIETLKGLVINEEPVSENYKTFKVVQEKWKNIGQVPQSHVKEIWNNYNHHVNKFFEYLNINNGLQQIDQKKNLELKEAICLKAEELVKVPYTEAVFQELQKLHAKWKKIGTVSKEKTEEIWQRLKVASDQVHALRQDFLAQYEEKRKQFHQAKVLLCETIEQLNIDELQTAKDWDKVSQDVLAVQKQWEDNETVLSSKSVEDTEIKKRFKAALDVFYEKKRSFYLGLRNQQGDNLEMKNELCKKTEEIASGTITDWEATTKSIKDIQQEWKEIGAVPARKSEKVWQRFRKACDEFFKRKSEHYATVKVEQENNLTKKEELISEIEKYQTTTIDEWRTWLADMQQKWNAIGYIPLAHKDKVMARYNQAVNTKYDTFNIGENQRKQLKFENKIKNITTSSDKSDLLLRERKEIEQTLNTLKSELLQLENNISFFGKSKKAAEVCAPFHERINKINEEMLVLKERLKMISIATRAK